MLGSMRRKKKGKKNNTTRIRAPCSILKKLNKSTLCRWRWTLSGDLNRHSLPHPLTSLCTHTSHPYFVFIKKASDTEHFCMLNKMNVVYLYVLRIVSTPPSSRIEIYHTRRDPSLHPQTNIMGIIGFHARQLMESELPFTTAAQNQLSSPSSGRKCQSRIVLSSLPEISHLPQEE